MVCFSLHTIKSLSYIFYCRENYSILFLYHNYQLKYNVMDMQQLVTILEKTASGGMRVYTNSEPLIIDDYHY